MQVQHDIIHYWTFFTLRKIAGDSKEGRKRKRKIPAMNILTSLKDNLAQRFRSKTRKNDEDDDEEEERRDRRRRNQNKIDMSPSLYQCGLCGSNKKFKECDVRILDNTQQKILKCRKKVDSLFLCKDHFQSDITNWLVSQTQCCNIFERHTKACKTNLVVVSLELAETCQDFTNDYLIPGQKLCYPCKRRLSESIEEERLRREQRRKEESEAHAEKKSETAAEIAAAKQTDTSWVPEEDEEDHAKSKLDKIYEILNLPKVNVEEAKDSGLSFKDKLNQLKGAVSSDDHQSQENEIYKNIKQKWSTYDKRQRATVLEVLPSSLKTSEIVELTGASKRLVNEVKKDKVQFERKQRSDKFGPDLQKMVSDFMLDEKNSRIGAGMQECVSVRNEDGDRVPLQKHYLSTTLETAYLNFKAEFPHIKIGLSKFKQFRPKNVIKYSDQEGGAQKCCCQMHENGSLLLDSTFIGELKEFKEVLNLNPDDKVTLNAVLKAFVCADTDDNESCWMNSCGDCLDRKESLRQAMIKMFQDLDTQTINYIQWDKEEGGNAVLKIASTVSQEEFCGDFVNKMYKLKKHDKITIHQRNKAFNLRKDLPLNHTMVTMDFAEAYTLSYQNATQNNFFHGKSIHILTSVIYMNRTGSVENQSFVVLTDECSQNSHTAEAVYCGYKKLNSWLDIHFPDRVHTYLQTDGCAKGRVQKE